MKSQQTAIFCCENVCEERFYFIVVRGGKSKDYAFGPYATAVQQTLVVSSSNISTYVNSFSGDFEKDDSPPTSPMRWSFLNSPLSPLSADSDRQSASLDDSQGAVPLSSSHNSSGIATTPQLISPMPRKSLLLSHAPPIAGRNLLDSFNSSEEEMSDEERVKRQKRERKKR